jgi:hypothetical protein
VLTEPLLADRPLNRDLPDVLRTLARSTPLSKHLER